VSWPDETLNGHAGLLATRAALGRLGLAERDPGELPTSAARFPDQGQWRVEIPSVEGPASFRAVLEEAERLQVPVHRISQGSGIMMQTGAELDEMIELGQSHGVEVALFVGPRASWDTGVQVTTSSGRVAAGSLRGTEQLVYGIEDVRRACERGLRWVLVADLGLLWVLGRLRESGDLPPDLRLKVSISLPVANPATARHLEDLGADSLNLPVDLSLSQIAGIRAAVSVPLDLYVEAADDFGGTVRHYETAELVRVAAPVHLKFTVRNAPGIYPSGGHLQPLVISSARERVRRAALSLELLSRYYPDAVPSPFTVPGSAPWAGPGSAKAGALA
jgi:Peptidase family U32